MGGMMMTMMINSKIIQAGIDSSSEREVNSSQQLKSLGIRYIRIENDIFEGDPPVEDIYNGETHLYKDNKQPLEFGLTKRHYGCWLSHKQSIMLGFTDKNHSLICEADCKILDIEKFKLRLQEAVKLLNTTDYPIVRFEKPNFAGVPTTFYNQVSENIWECDQVALGQCYLVNHKCKKEFEHMFNNIGWHAFDWWLSLAFKQSNLKQLCFKEDLTYQFSGHSQIDEIYKDLDSHYNT